MYPLYILYNVRIIFIHCVQVMFDGVTKLHKKLDLNPFIYIFFDFVFCVLFCLLIHNI
jgi:hypothetical protein